VGQCRIGASDAERRVTIVVKEITMAWHDVPTDEYEAIEREIQSAESPVGIDAKHTHVLVLHKLAAIEARLERLEAALATAGTPVTAGSSKRR
jgi:hypothetical protein